MTPVNSHQELPGKYQISQMKLPRKWGSLGLEKALLSVLSQLCTDAHLKSSSASIISIPLSGF